MSKITLSWGGSVYVGKPKETKSIGRWSEQWRGGSTLFRGRMAGEREWSDWMKKRELREWFAARANVDEVQG